MDEYIVTSPIVTSGFNKDANILISEGFHKDSDIEIWNATNYKLLTKLDSLHTKNGSISFSFELSKEMDGQLDFIIMK